MPLDLRGVITWDDRSGPALSKLEGNMQRLSQVGKTVTIAGAAITGALTASMHSAAAYGDEIAKASAKTNISTQELSRLRYAAEQTGSNFNTMTGSLARMQRAALDASEGSKTQQEAFDRLGVSVVDTNGELKGAEQLFKEIAQGLSEQENRTLRAATAMQIFGRGGVNMLPLLNEGAAGIEKLGQRAEELGIVWDEKASKAAERYNDALNDVKRSTQGLGQTLVVTLGPAVAEAAETVAEAMGTFSEWADKNPEWARVIVFSIAGIGLALGVGGPILVALPYLLNGLNAIRTAFTTTATTAEVSAGRVSRAGVSMGVAAKGMGGAGVGTGVGALATGAGVAVGAYGAYRGSITALEIFKANAQQKELVRIAEEAKGAGETQTYHQAMRDYYRLRHLGAEWGEEHMFGWGRKTKETEIAQMMYHTRLAGGAPLTMRELDEYGLGAASSLTPDEVAAMQRRLVQQGASQQTVGRLTQHFSGYVEAPRTSLEASKLRDMGVLQVNVNLSGQGNIAETMLKDPQAREQMSRFIGEEAMKASYAPGG